MVTPIEYAHYLECDEIEKLIKAKMNEPSLEARWLKKVESLDQARIEPFHAKLKDPNIRRDLVNLLRYLYNYYYQR
jgi:hypothetical protein